MATNLAATLSALVIVLAPYAGAAFAEDQKQGPYGGAAESGPQTSYKDQVGARRGESSSESIQQRFGGGSVILRGSAGSAGSSSATGRSTGNRINLEGGEWRRFRGDGPPPEKPRKSGSRPTKGQSLRDH